MSNLGDLQSRALRELVGTHSIGVATVNLQNGTATFDSVCEADAQVISVIGGFPKAVANRTDEALVTLAALQSPITGYETYYDQPVSTTVYYVWVVNAAGTDYVIQGTYEGQALGPYIGPKGQLGDGLIPNIVVADTYAPIAVFRVVNGATAVFTPATTFWDATSVVSSAAPVNVLPESVSDLTFTAGGS
jgi:hypothetical protein